MKFHFESPKNFSSTIKSKDVAAQVKNNLTEWGYNISVDDTEYTDHELRVQIGEVRRDSTPAGFSFSIGNSDPRALDFQKTKILPMTCFLSPKNQPEKSAELTMEVLANEYLKNNNKSDYLSKLLIDDLSTVCFNLLSHLKIKISIAKSSENKKTTNWTPKIRVENEDDADTKVEEIEKKINIKPTNKNNTSDKNLITETPKKKQTRVKKEPRKRVIIDNQGSPVIFKFGHERK